MFDETRRRRKVAVVGAGISGLSAAWLMSRSCDVTLFEREDRLGGHANTHPMPGMGEGAGVDTGFIVFNEATYPNFCALLDHLGVASVPSEMSFAVSLDDGRLEYNGTSLGGLFAQRSNILRPRFWSMLQDLLRFYRSAPRDVSLLGADLVSLGEYLEAGRYGRPFRDDHLLPMAGAIWSAPCAEILSYPVASFVRFQSNHGLLKLAGRPVWRTVSGGSARYVERLRAAYQGEIAAGVAVRGVRRGPEGCEVLTDAGARAFDHVVLACHADEALALLVDPSADETRTLGAFRYNRNLAVLHRDPALMPRRRAAWASWNHIGDRARPGDPCAATYWMNRLQALSTPEQYFVTLNPPRPPRDELTISAQTYAHPLFDAAAIAAQARLWALQGQRSTWFCGAYFGAGFHEDGLQAGLAVAEQLAGVRRPWTVADESGRIVLGPPLLAAAA